MLFDQILQQFPERLTLRLLLQNPGDVPRNGIGSSGLDFPVDPRQLIRGQADGNLRPGHTSIIPPVRWSSPSSEISSPVNHSGSPGIGDEGTCRYLARALVLIPILNNRGRL